MASETVDPIDWSHPPPSWAVPPERHVHSTIQCNISWTRTCNRSMRGNHLAYAATQGMGLREQSIVGCFSEFVFQFSVAQVLVGLRKQFINNFVFRTWACAAGFNHNINYYYMGTLLATFYSSYASLRSPHCYDKNIVLSNLTKNIYKKKEFMLKNCQVYDKDY